MNLSLSNLPPKHNFCLQTNVLPLEGVTLTNHAYFRGITTKTQNCTLPVRAQMALDFGVRQN